MLLVLYCCAMRVGFAVVLLRCEQPVTIVLAGLAYLVVLLLQEFQRRKAGPLLLLLPPRRLAVMSLPFLSSLVSG